MNTFDRANLNTYMTGATLMVSVEDPRKTYLCVDDIRFVFEEGMYIGWYKP